MTTYTPDPSTGIEDAAHEAVRQVRRQGSLVLEFNGFRIPVWPTDEPQAVIDRWWNVRRESEQQTDFQAALDAVRSLTAEQRKELFRHFCKECGGDDPGCYCWNDE